MQKAIRGLAGVAGLVAACLAPPASGADYPNRPVRFIVPFPPGGNTTLLARAIGDKLTAAWGQPVVIDNRGGAGGVVGVELASHAQPDGYTLVMASFGNIITAPFLRLKLPYDPVTSFAPVSLVSTPPGVYVVHPLFPARSVKELIAYAKANPGKVDYASSGVGTWNHLYAELLAQTAGIKLIHVPYRGGGPAQTDLLGGHVKSGFTIFTGATQHIEAGRLRALAVTGKKRSALLPSVPTMDEAGVPGYEAVAWFAVLAPAGTPKPIIGQLNRDVVAALKAPDVVAFLTREGAEPAPSTPEEAARSIKENQQKWGAIIKRLGLKPE